MKEEKSVNGGGGADVNDCTKTYKAEEEHVTIVFVTTVNHLAMLAKNFKKYFLVDDKLIASYEWVRLSIDKEEKFISGKTKRQFSNKLLFEFWAGVENDFSALKTRAFLFLLLVSTSYLCETGFSAVVSLKTKYRSQLNIEQNGEWLFLILSLPSKNFAVQDRPKEVTNNY